MPDKPTTAAGYRSVPQERVKATCLQAATRLGNLMDELVIVGGLVPSLLIDPRTLPAGVEEHAGTMDLDLGMEAGLLDRQRYRSLVEALRRGGFYPDANERGNPTRQRWRSNRPGGVTVDFLIPPSGPADKGGMLRDIEPDFAAVIASGLHLAFRDRERVSLSGRTLSGERVEREVSVCGPGAFVVLKALAFRDRCEAKDAYDLHYVIRNYAPTVDAVAGRLRMLLDDPAAVQALGILGEDFLSRDAMGPSAVAAFRGRERDDGAQEEEVVTFVGALLGKVGRPFTPAPPPDP